MNQAVCRLGEDHRVLRPSGALRLWERIIEEDAQTRGLSLLRFGTTAKLAMKAHDLLVDYAVQGESLFLGEDQEAFLRWRRRYQEACREGSWIDPMTLADHVGKACRAGKLRVDRDFLLTGFDDIPPRLRRLAESLKFLHRRVEEVPAPVAPAGDVARLPCLDAREEIRNAARWARRLLEEGRVGIGIVSPDLSSVRSLIERIFLEEIEPAALLALSDEEKGFNLSLGAPLAHQGPIVTALTLLGTARDISMDALSGLLRSPYLRGAEREGGRRAGQDRFLRSLRRDLFSLSDMIELISGEKIRSEAAPALPIMKNVVKAMADSGENRRRALPGYWANEFSLLLQAVGWPGERSLDSREFQVVQAWREKVLPEFSALDLVSGPMSRAEAVGQIRKLAMEMEFQPEGSESGLQVCGVLEAGGLEFEHLWVMGLHEKAWPSPPRPNPFLPVSLQVSCRMPHCDAVREADFARRVMTRLRAAAPDIVFSHPLQEGDCELRPSPLIHAIPPAPVPLTDIVNPLVRTKSAAPPLEPWLDDHGPPLSGSEPMSGGTAILKDQALCPFRAFAHHRLAARGFDSPTPGLDPRTRGTLVHFVLESFWRKMGNRSNLDRLDGIGLRQRIDETVLDGVRTFFSEHPPSPAPPIVEIETTRLQELLSEWVEKAERPRGDFSIDGLEEPHEEEFGGLRIRTKIDRIDLLPDGRRVIIDYKTGRVRLDDLLTERLLDPQLPIYVIGADRGGDGSTPAGVAVGQLRRGDCSLKGIARDEDLLAGTPGFSGSSLARRHDIGSWEDLLLRWRTGLENLGRGFAEGWAAVDPVDNEKACRTCDLASFCRIAEIQPAFPADGAEPWA